MTTMLYIAGPDVFEPDARMRGERMKKVAEACGFQPLFPADNEIDPEAGQDASRLIYEANRSMIDAADMVVANLSPFRGAEPDSGTVWEVAYAIGRGKCVVGYIESAETLHERVLRLEGRARDASDEVDKQGRFIESFGHQLNLMLMHSIDLVVGDYGAACLFARQRCASCKHAACSRFVGCADLQQHHSAHCVPRYAQEAGVLMVDVAAERDACRAKKRPMMPNGTSTAADENIIG